MDKESTLRIVHSFRLGSLPAPTGSLVEDLGCKEFLPMLSFPKLDCLETLSLGDASKGRLRFKDTHPKIT